jgi:uncharacterized repeat protein (TIGR03806 family)
VDFPFPSMASASSAERSVRAVLLCAAALLAGCSSDKAPGAARDGGGPEAGGGDASSAGLPDASQTPAKGVTAAPDGSPWDTLAEWHLFTDPVKQVPQDRVIPYDVNSQLFADYAQKRRFIYVPPGAAIQYSTTDTWKLPVGTILVKTFSYLADARDPTKGERLLETRLLIHEVDGWVPRTYVWNDAQSTATLEVAGTVIPSKFIDPSGNAVSNAYVVPNGSACRECHGTLGFTDTLGGRTRQLDRDHDYGSGPENQIDHLAKLGFFAATPEPVAARQRLVDPFDKANPLQERVRSYFDGNCGHCHQPAQGGETRGATSSGLFLDYASTAPGQSDQYWGRCKQPAAAGGGTCGRAFDVSPGAPGDSILLCRLESTTSKSQMPPVGRNLVHAEGVALMKEWVAQLPGSCGPPPPPPPPLDAGAAKDAAPPPPPATDSGPG